LAVQQHAGNLTTFAKKLLTRLGSSADNLHPNNDILEPPAYILASICRHKDIFKACSTFDKEETARIEDIINKHHVCEALQEAVQAVFAIVENQGWKFGDGEQKSFKAGSVLANLFVRRTGISPSEDHDNSCLGWILQYQGALLGIADSFLSLLMLPSGCMQHALENDWEGVLWKALAISVEIENFNTDGSAVSWWVKGHTTISPEGEKLHIGHCTCTPRETLLLCLKRLLKLKGRDAQVSRAVAERCGLDTGQEAPLQAKAVDDAERVRLRGNQKMKAADDYPAALFYYSFAIELLEHYADSKFEPLAVLHGNRAEVLLRLRRGEDAERDAKAALNIQQNEKNQRRLERAIELQGK